jgi:osmotically inducible lipoprotein OsmB
MTGLAVPSPAHKRVSESLATPQSLTSFLLRYRLTFGVTDGDIIMTRTIALRALAGTLLLALVGCGYSPGQRAVSGGLLGAGAGAGVSALTGGKAGRGALIGGGLGALGGAVTAP